MEPAVRQYEIQLIQPKATWVKRIIWCCALVDFSFIAWSVGDAILHSHQQALMDALFMPVVFATLLVFASFKRSQPKAAMTIGPDFIESCVRATWFRNKKRIRREQIKFISESRRGLRVMDRGKLGSIILGYIVVPATMPEYQEIRSELARWAPIKGNS